MILKLKKNEISHNKSPISINNIDVNKTVVYKKVSFSKSGFKSFIDYRDAKTIRPLCIFLLKWVHIEKIDKAKCISFFDKRWKTV